MIHVIKNNDNGWTRYESATTDSAESILEESKTIDGIDGIFDRISKATDIGQKARKHNIKSSWVI